jgi:hypothetical protein
MNDSSGQYNLMCSGGLGSDGDLGKGFFGLMGKIESRSRLILWGWFRDGAMMRQARESVLGIPVCRKERILCGAVK